MKRYGSVAEYFDDLEKWSKELKRLREILQSTGLTEALKWSIPNYLYGKKIVCGICGFKNYFGIWFHQGALLDDEYGVLMNAQEGKTNAMRQWRMTRFKDIKARIIKSYIKQSLEKIDQGIEIKPVKKGDDVLVPVELESALKKNRLAGQQFKKLSPYKQREFAEYIETAKRADTKLRRLEKILPMIVEGIGLNDRYRKSC